MVTSRTPLKLAQTTTTRSTAEAPTVPIAKKAVQVTMKSTLNKQVTTATHKTISQQPKSINKTVPTKPTITTVTRGTQPAKSIKQDPVFKKPVTTPTVVKLITKSGSTAKKLSAQQALAKINAIIKQNHFMGTLLVTNNGPAGVKVFTYGDANVAKKIANTNDEVYPLASLEKALTGAVIQRLINQHKLTMNTTLSRFYPQVRYARDITIRELLDHTSGIRMDEPIPDHLLTGETAEVDFTIRHLKSTNQHVWSYSNANFTLLAGIVSKITGKSFMSTLQTDVLNPLGMKHTFVYNQVPSNMLKPLAYTYSDGTSTADAISTKLLSSELGCGNVYASVEDYYTFINSLVTGKLDTTAGFMELTDNLKPIYSGGIYYRSDHTIRIGGADNDFRSYYVGTTDGKVAVVLFVNQGDWTIGNTVDSQMEQILSQASSL
ncbi:serine-type D-Ala-D-Ala carboxypeptidase [Lactiplantibacillus xiangfangensis]|uniref:Serine-type D-Ala-D-Ala carboxypeptidase n=2 Tax=Lactiplantibacillus xiangfangensis TaxID=942150 RepID=A0A0R2MLK6_9LACO|nr:serine-type D-Ala-D-Ala carboxypeptidase [Lactiplantibacillus xiangfangensis]